MEDEFREILDALEQVTFERDNTFAMKLVNTNTTLYICPDDSVEDVDSKMKNTLRQLLTRRPQLFQDILEADNLRTFISMCEDLDVWLYDRDMFIVLRGNNFWTDLKIRLMVKSSFFFKILS